MAGTAQHATNKHTQPRGSGAGGAAVVEPAGLARPEFLSVGQFCKLTGLSSSTVRRLITQKQIPTYQPGGPRCRVLIHSDALRQIQEPNQAKGRGSAAGDGPASIPGPDPRWRKSCRSNINLDPEDSDVPKEQ